MRRFLYVLLAACFVGCGGAKQSVMIDKGFGDKIPFGKEKRRVVYCREGGESKRYIWVEVREGVLPFDKESGLWKFVGLDENKKVVKVVSSECWMVQEVDGGGDDWGVI